MRLYLLFFVFVACFFTTPLFAQQNTQAEADSFCRTAVLQFHAGHIDSAALMIKKAGLTHCVPLFLSEIDHTAALDNDQIRHKGNVARMYNEIGKLYKAENNFSTAAEYLKLFHTHSAELYRQHPDLRYLKQNLIISYDELSRLAEDMGDLENAMRYLEQGARLTHEMLSSDPADHEAKSYLSSFLAMAGVVHLKKGAHADAIGYFRQSSQIDESLILAEPKKPTHKAAYAVNQLKIGECLTAMDSLEDAFYYFEAYYLVFVQLHRDWPQNLEYLNSLAIASQMMGHNYDGRNNIDSAAVYFELFNRHALALCAADPKEPFYRTLLATSYVRLGDPFTKRGEWDKAFEYYEKGTAQLKVLYESYPENIQYQHNWAISTANLGFFCANRFNDKKRAKKYYKQAESAWAELSAKHPDHAQFSYFLENVRADLKRL